MTEATPSVRPIIENTGATATAAAETLMKTIAMDGNRINIPIDVRQVAERLGWKCSTCYLIAARTA